MGLFGESKSERAALADELAAGLGAVFGAQTLRMVAEWVIERGPSNPTSGDLILEARRLMGNIEAGRASAGTTEAAVKLTRWWWTTGIREHIAGGS